MIIEEVKDEKSLKEKISLVMICLHLNIAIIVDKCWTGIVMKKK